MALDFSTVSNLVIPDGKVAYITDADGNVLWENQSGFDLTITSVSGTTRPIFRVDYADGTYQNPLSAGTYHNVRTFSYGINTKVTVSSGEYSLVSRTYTPKTDMSISLKVST